MKDISSDPKQQAILGSAFQAFATYGFRKTSMDDIARGAGMSRPALYQHYRNKEDICRSLVQHHYDKATTAVSEALNAPGSVTELLTAAMMKQGEGIAALLASPHGMELLDASSSMASDIVDVGEGALQKLYADWMTREVAKGRVHLSGEAPEIAATLTTALKGVKSHAPDFEVYSTRVHLLAAISGAGLSVK
ncbi:TetR/AcrR family transcriptional regulator [Tropicibacter sp. Alg240-R139]|uniref:TetR/AcrR family transcriptional regulator n=1 Tax=Tropicibacter sp. Alg240-R139 TaxID=2305991 RepID=UPI0013DF2E07|nr:TetR/AcrR family transcriptional regulator [Tropicibacter sp. Alg240-R139]